MEKSSNHLREEFCVFENQMMVDMSSEKEKKEERFERAFEMVGGHGKYQLILIAIISFQLVVMTWNHLGYVFLGAVPNHSCHVPQLASTNWTLEQRWKLSVPLVKGDNSSEDEGDNEKWDKCHYYDLNYTDIVSKSSGHFPSALSMAQLERDVKGDQIKECSQWDFDHSLYISTVATEFNLVCDRRYLAATIQSTYMMGGFVGSLAFGSISDKILGRRNSVLISITLVITAGMAAAFANSYILFVCLRFIIAIGVAGCMQNCFVLLVENSGISHRAFYTLVSGVSFGVGYAVMPLYAFFFRDWSSLQLAFSMTSTILLLYFWILPESPRWLATNGKDEAAVKLLEKIAKVNKMPPPNKEKLLSIIRDCQGSKVESRENELSSCQLVTAKGRAIALNFKSLVSTAEMRRRTFTLWVLFFTVAFVYYGFSFSTNLSSNPFLLVTLGGLIEIPANFMAIPFLSWWGRRPTMTGLYFLTALSALAITVTPLANESARVILSMTGKFFVAAAFNVVYLLTSELYPTEARTTGQSVVVVCGRLGSIASPYVVDLMGETYADLPCLIFGILSIVAGFVTLCLPETKDEDMADQMNQIKHSSHTISLRRLSRKESITRPPVSK